MSLENNFGQGINILSLNNLDSIFELEEMSCYIYCKLYLITLIFKTSWIFTGIEKLHERNGGRKLRIRAIELATQGHKLLPSLAGIGLYSRNFDNQKFLYLYFLRY